MNLTKEIRKLTLAEGFHKVGIASANKINTGNHLLEWLRRGYHGDMDWFVKNKNLRIDVKKYFPAAKSIICVAHNYYQDQTLPSDTGGLKISRYAWGRGYHKIIKNKLENVLNKIKKLKPGLEGITCVDTSPVTEKAWAVQAGIGWQGKHTVVISKEYGSWFFLGEIIVDRYLDYDDPAENLCGDCRLCVEACPTGAIVAPYVLDARKCIAYMTIENSKDRIPPHLAKKMNNWIYGCDICQQVCPWNKKYQHTTGETCYLAEFDLNLLNKQYMGTLDRERFDNLFKESEIGRLGYKHFMRNIQAVSRFK